MTAGNPITSFWLMFAKAPSASTDLGPRVAGLQARCYNSSPRGTMLNLTKVVRQLKQERDQARNRMERLDEALKVLSSLAGVKRGFARGPGVRRTMSAASRKRIAAAQRALGKMESRTSEEIET